MKKLFFAAFLAFICSNFVVAQTANPAKKAILMQEGSTVKNVKTGEVLRTVNSSTTISETQVNGKASINSSKKAKQNSSKGAAIDKSGAYGKYTIKGVTASPQKQAKPANASDSKNSQMQNYYKNNANSISNNTNSNNSNKSKANSTELKQNEIKAGTKPSERKINKTVRKTNIKDNKVFQIKSNSDSKK